VGFFILFLLPCLTLFSLVPIYDGSSQPFLFTKEDFVGLPSLHRFKKHGDPKLADLPPNALVTVFFTLNSYTSTRAPPTPSTVKTWSRSDQDPVPSGSSQHDNPVAYPPSKGSSAQSDNTGFGSSQVLSPNLQFLLFHEVIPDDD
jgi:hypothetical protein